MSQFGSVMISVWSRMRLLRRLQALRARGLKVKRRGGLLVIEGGKTKGAMLLRTGRTLGIRPRTALTFHSRTH